MGVAQAVKCAAVLESMLPRESNSKARVGRRAKLYVACNIIYGKQWLLLPNLSPYKIK